MSPLLGCFCLSKDGGSKLQAKERAVLASKTYFTVNEIEALYDLYKKLSSSVVNDGLLHKEEFQLALFNDGSKQNLFADRLFNVFDMKHNGVIEFGEFVCALNIFHPSAPESEKISFVFKLFDLRGTGYIEREELKEMVMELLREKELTLPDDAVEEILNKTISDADLTGDGRINPEEWKEFVARYPSIVKNMTLPLLRELTQAFPSFVVKTDVQDSELLYSVKTFQ